jgi:adenylate kinase
LISLFSPILPSLPYDSLKIFFVLGGPGSGKGTQCAKIAEKYGFAHISTGDLLRQEVIDGTELGKRAKSLMLEGKMIPIVILFDIGFDDGHHYQ